MLNAIAPQTSPWVSPLVPLLLFGWAPIVLVMFMFLPPRRAVIIAFFSAWLFLPMAGYRFTLIPDYSKMTATCFGVLLGSIVFDLRRVMSFRPKLWDMPMLLWCFTPVPSSLTNGLGIYDGLSESLVIVTTWGLPYFIGRIYFSDMQSLRTLAIAIVIGGLIYVPLCMWESRLSPQLHRIFYGFHQHMFYQTMRLGGFRPMVFMQHGLMVATWMTTASLVAVWLWASGSVRHIWTIPIAILALLLLFTALLCRSVGAMSLLIGGLGALFMVKWLRTPIPVICIIVSVPIYIFLRAPGIWTGDNLVSVAKTFTNPRAAHSLNWRFSNEKIIAARAMQKPIFGWGGWGRSRVKDEWGKPLAYVDGLWIVTFGRNGFAGITTMLGMILAPVALFLWRFRTDTWSKPETGHVAALIMLLCLYTVDCLPNAMINPIYMLASGGLIGVMTLKEISAPTRVRRPGRRIVHARTRRVARSPVPSAAPAHL